MIEGVTYEQCIKNMQKYFKQIKQNFPNYEDRAAQKNMIMAILKGYETDKNVMIEAPTGTGKSLGYLLPFLSAWEQIEDKEKKPTLVIATNTIALQEQLISKDIPYFKKLLGDIDFKAILVKGRSNYICLKKIDNIFNNERGVFESVEEAREFQFLLPNISKGKEVILGDRSKIEYQISGNLWSKMCSESDDCLKRKCKFYDKCFFYDARKKQREADVLITNHSLFFADLTVRIETNFEVEDLVLPEYDFLVFDEAHHIEDVASDFLGVSISRFRLKRLFSDIKRHVTRGDLADFFDTNSELKMEIVNVCNGLDAESDVFFQDIVSFVGTEDIKRLKEKDKNFISIEHLKQEIKQIINSLKESRNIAEFSDEEEATCSSIVNRCEKILRELETIVTQNKEDYAYWIESPKKENRHYFTSLQACPVSVSEILGENLFQRQTGITLTSATMGTNNMSYIASRIGVSDYISAMFHSPFNYKEQSKIYVPLKALNPKTQGYDQYLEDEIKKILQATKGRALVLFTAYSLMNMLGEKFRPIVEDMGYTFLKQGDMPRTPLIQNFRTDINSVLFATSSYWEGIDVPGESLSCVIITKLPFEVPDRPIIEARMESLEKEGKNPFLHYQVPMAVMKFKQGFGRLIRTSSDKGIVAVLDNRLVSMNYGQQFVRSLPEVPITRNIQDISSLLG